MAKKKPGRPPEKVPQDIAAAIVEWISEGKTLQDFCRQEGMPKPRTVSDWKAKDEKFAADFAGARALGFDALAAQCLRISDTPLEGEETKVDANGNVIEIKRGDMLGHRKLQIETRLKLLAKWDPKRYGELVKMEHAGKDGGAIEFLVKVDRDPGA